MSVTFVIDDVPPAESSRATFPLAPRLGAHQALGVPVSEVIDSPDAHPLLAAVHVAFAEHRALVLSPDAIWLTIAQGVAQHVRLNAEPLRGRLVQHRGTAKISVVWNGIPDGHDDWAEVVQRFRTALAERVGSGRARLFGCNFTTTTPDAAVAGDIVLMDVFSPYFAYELMCVCGIPRCTLTGTPDDWRKIRARIEVIAEFDLEEWARSLRVIADQLVAASEGRHDVSFWKGIYKPVEAYGADRVTGWIARLFPYLHGDGGFDRPNPMLALPMRKPKIEDGITLRDVPNGRSQVLIQLVDAGAGGGDRDVLLEGGLLGVSQDGEGRLEPVIGWLARPATASIAAMIEQIRADHVSEPAPPRTPHGMFLGGGGSADVAALFRELAEATLFATTGPWRLRPEREQERIDVPTAPYHHVHVTRVIDLPDGGTLAQVQAEPGWAWVRLEPSELEAIASDDNSNFPLPPGVLPLPHAPRRTTRQHAANVPVLAGTFAQILGHALGGGKSADLPRTGEMLLDWLPPMYRMPLPSPAERAAEREREKAERLARVRDKKRPKP